LGGCPFLEEPTDLVQPKRSRPKSFWRANRHQFPKLKHFPVSKKKNLKDFPQARRGRDTPVDSKFQTQNENNRAWAFHSQFALPQPKTEPKKLLEFLPPRQTSYSKMPKIFIAA
jgi:hypothetical protein